MRFRRTKPEDREFNRYLRDLRIEDKPEPDMPMMERGADHIATGLGHALNTVQRVIELPGSVAERRGRSEGVSASLRILCYVLLILFPPGWLILLAWVGTMKRKG